MAIVEVKGSRVCNVANASGGYLALDSDHIFDERYMNFGNMEHEPAAIAADSPYSVMPSAHAFEPVGGGGGGPGGGDVPGGGGGNGIQAAQILISSEPERRTKCITIAQIQRAIAQSGMKLLAAMGFVVLLPPHAVASMCTQPVIRTLT